MSARGVTVNHNGSTLAGAHWTSANFLSPEVADFSFCMWVQINGVSIGSNTDGHVAVCFPANSAAFYGSGGFDIYTTTATSASPWTFTGRIHNGGGVDDESMASMATSENWFLAMSWDNGTQTATWYWAKDGDVALNTTTGTRTMTASQNLDGVRFGALPEGDNAGSRLTFTCARLWSEATSSADFLDEMKSATVVHGTNLHSFWPLLNAADTSDASGNGHTLTMVGSVTDGTMDPADIATAPASRRIFVIA